MHAANSHRQRRPAALSQGRDEINAPWPSLPLNSHSALRLLERSAQHSPDSVVIFGPDGVCGWANQATATLLGIRDCAGLVGRLDLRRHCSLPGDAGGAALSQALRGQTQERLSLCYDLEALGARTVAPEGGAGNPQCPGKVLVANVQLVPLLDEYGGVVALWVFNEMPGQSSGPAPEPESLAPGAPDPEDARMGHCIGTARLLARRMAHDFNNIMAVVQGYAGMLKDRLKQDTESRGMAELIGQMGDEATSVTSRLAAFANAHPLELADVNLNRVVESFLASPQAAAPAGVQVHLELAADLPPLFADQESLERICANLWENALEAMPKGGKIAWRTEVVSQLPQTGQAAPRLVGASFLRLRVADTGEGMDEATRRSVFDPFFTTKHGKSRGLGLTEVYLTVKEHHGFVEVSSQPGAGTTMELYFPVLGVAEQAQAKAVNAPPTESPPDGVAQGHCWMVVDDNNLVRRLVEQMLVQAGRKVVTAASGAEALDIFQRQARQIDGVFLDLTLGDLTGAQVFHRLREINPQVPMILLSGDTTQPAVDELMAQGGCRVLSKPFKREDLLALVNQPASGSASGRRAA